MAKTVFVIISSFWGHTKALADSIIVGLKETGVNAVLYQVPETLPQEVLDKMHATKFDIPVITLEELVKADGFLFGIPTRFGTMGAQMKAFFDSCGGIWAKGELAGKHAGCFTSSASQHGGQETTILTTIPFFAHQGMLFVPLGYTSGLLSDNSEIVGGGPWGAAAISSSDGSRQVSAKEHAIAKWQGVNFGTIINRVK